MSDTSITRKGAKNGLSIGRLLLDGRAFFALIAIILLMRAPFMKNLFKRQSS